MKISIRSKPNGSLDLSRAISGELLKSDMEAFNAALLNTLEAQRGYLTEVEYDLYGRGKKLRPLMLMLFSRLCVGPEAALHEKVLQGAVAVEMLHVASLIHDDIIDQSVSRRGLPTVHASRGTGTAILVGDLQFLQSIRGFVDTIRVESDMGLVKMVLDTAFDICRGELDELQTNPHADVPELMRRYMQTIDRKTAILFGLACESGVTLSDGHTSDARRAGFYGRRLGRAFQIMDDIYDFTQSSAESGKDAYADLANRRLSLPILYAIKLLGDDSRVARHMRGDSIYACDLNSLANEVIDCGAVLKAYADAREQALEAVTYLAPFGENRYTKALRDIALFTVNRI